METILTGALLTSHYIGGHRGAGGPIEGNQVRVLSGDA